MSIRVKIIVFSFVVLTICGYAGYQFMLRQPNVDDLGNSRTQASIIDLRNSRTEASFIVFELHNYSLFNEGKLPPAIELSEDGNPMHSWRFVSCRLLFGDTVQSGFYGHDAKSAYDFAWDDPHNKRYFDGPHRYYGGSPNSFIDFKNDDHTTRYAAITGPDTAFDKNKSVRLRDLDDDTILFVETRKSDHHWMQPGGDFNILTMPKTIGNPKGISGRSSQGFIVAFADGEAWVLTHDIPFTTLEPFFTITGSKARNRDEELDKFKW